MAVYYHLIYKNMKKITRSQIIITSLILGLVLALPVAFARAQDANRPDDAGNQAEANRNEAAQNRPEANENKEENKGGLNGDDHRSAVATFVQDLLKVADREQGGIGEEVRVIAQEQNDDKEEVAREIDEVNNRSGFKTFFIGTDYKNLGNLRSAIAKTQTQIDRLTR